MSNLKCRAPDTEPKRVQEHVIFFSLSLYHLLTLLFTQIKLTRGVPEARDTETLFTVEVKKIKSYIVSFCGGAYDSDRWCVW